MRLLPTFSSSAARWLAAPGFVLVLGVERAHVRDLPGEAHELVVSATSAADAADASSLPPLDAACSHGCFHVGTIQRACASVAPPGAFRKMAGEAARDPESIHAEVTPRPPNRLA